MRRLIKNFFYINLFIGSVYFYATICNKEKKSIKNETEIIKEEHTLDKYYRVIYRVSYLSFIPSIYAMYRGYYDLSIMCGGVTLTSINFWKNPDFSWRRELDIHFVRLSILYHLFRAYNAENGKIYYIISGSAITCYPIGIYFFINKKYWYFTISHALVHILGDLSNFVLYSGNIPEIKFK